MSPDEFAVAIDSFSSTYRELISAKDHVLAANGKQWINIETRGTQAPNSSRGALEAASAITSSLPELRITVGTSQARQSSLRPRHSLAIDAELVIDEVIEHDPECLPFLPSSKADEVVIFSVLLSPTYSVPVLYFWPYDVHNDAPRLVSLEHLDQFIPSSIKPQVQNVGVLGGVSICVSVSYLKRLSQHLDLTKNHPSHYFPVYFIHPCNTHAALLAARQGINQQLTSKEHLLLWFGLVGSVVGISIPMRLARALGSKQDEHEQCI